VTAEPETAEREPAYEFACRLGDVPSGLQIHVDVGGVPLAVARCDDGTVRAIYDECSHEAVPLSEGEIDGCTIECWLHGSRFDLRTGIPTGPPAIRPVPVYPVLVEGDGDDAAVLVDVTAGT
jgi:3-phenylpropionate/trans-cinnamate dioxygenase ferredoxin subunit